MFSKGLPARARAFFLFCIMVNASCDPVSMLIGGATGKATVDSALTGVNEAITRLNKIITDQRTGIKLDALQVLDVAVREAKRLAHDAANLAMIVEGKAAADLASILARTTADLDRLTTLLTSAASDVVLTAAIEARRLIEEAGNQARSLSKQLKDVVDHTEHAAGRTVRRVENLVVTAILTLGGIAVLAIAATLLMVRLVRRRKEPVGKGTWIAVPVVMAVGLALAIGASPLSKAMAGELAPVPDVKAACEAMSRDGEILSAQLAPAASLAGTARLGWPQLDRPLPTDLRELENAVRGGARKQIVTRTWNLDAGLRLDRIELVPLPGAAILDGGRAVPRYMPGVLPGVSFNPVVITRPPGLQPLVIPGLHATGVLTGRPQLSETDLVALAERVRDSAATCSAFSTTMQAELAERYYIMAASYLGEPAVCHSSNQCAAGMKCDTLSGECLAVGIYCEDPTHCADGNECDMTLRRCAPRAQFRCSTTQRCRAGEYCMPTHQCELSAKVVGQPCTVPGAKGPCKNGTYIDNGAGAPVCNDVYPRTRDDDCDGLDEDCNGVIDDAFVGGACVAAAPGTCSVGARRCTGAGDVCEAGLPGAQEICENEVDEDCDGLLDNEGCPLKEEQSQDVGCGWGCRNDTVVGGACRPGYRRHSCRPVGPQDSTAYAQFTGWLHDDPHSCACKIHAATWGARSAVWTIEILSVREAR